jgi:hypothetical protein
MERVIDPAENRPPVFQPLAEVPNYLRHPGPSMPFDTSIFFIIVLLAVYIMQ